MKFKLDKFNGIVIDSLTLPENVFEFHKRLTETIKFSLTANKNLIWLTIPINKSQLVKTANDLGFVFHSCLEAELNLIRKASSITTFIPFIPTHTLGAGAIICNEQEEILVVRENEDVGYKLPGGYVELGENLVSSIVREVYEETGVETKFESIVGIASSHPSQFGKTNLYFVCKLHPIFQKISINDMDEIADAKWVAISDFIKDTQNALFNRQVVESLAGSVGLSLVSLDGNEGPFMKQETFFS